MIQEKHLSRRTRRIQDAVPISTQQKERLLHGQYDEISRLNCVESSETSRGYQYCLRMPGYIETDFTCFKTQSHLVITTEKNVQDANVSSNKRSYCYPSAYFKIHIPLPEYPITDQVKMHYEKDLLCVDLFKL